MDDVIDRICAATNAHDLDALVGCFADDYRLEMPVHPGRDFRGSAQVRTNWAQIFAGVPDLRAEVRARASDGPSRWTEWRMWGTRRDGVPHDMRGVAIFEVGNEDGVERARACRFYLEPVEYDSGTVDDDIRRRVGP
ncbi:nuclear transport factor 2 family protein [Microbacterium sp. ASV49]|uniref:Nuclear transport factor 2 family protein n=1 Tax=Microbacterium candidum TaxID=3041922 RepID=A0ABT7MYE2_9MICO|nr:nuclear transport factor 2 family protein [Microbacterium sp. ASV49]MDL9979451.1 nuclear transport factor 2 family protein [Microbacterium sp. ASV49]